MCMSFSAVRLRDSRSPADAGLTGGYSAARRLLFKSGCGAFFFTGAGVLAHFLLGVNKRALAFAVTAFEQSPAQQWKGLHLDSVFAGEGEIGSDCKVNLRRAYRRRFEREDTELSILFEAGEHELHFQGLLLHAHAGDWCC